MFVKKPAGMGILPTVVILSLVAFRGSANAVCAAAVGCGHVPELDPYMIGAGITVFGGAGALLIERYRRRKR
jgi:hypothetical protein